MVWATVRKVMDTPDIAELRDKIKRNLEQIQANIEKAAKRAGRNSSEIQIVAATKTVGANVIEAAIECGVKIIGENRVQEAREKFERVARGGRVARDGLVAGGGRVGREAEWHFIGHLQKNKVKYAIDFFALVHSVDSVELAREINRRAEAAGKVVRILLQVNIGEEETKFGLEPAIAVGTATEIGRLPNIKLEGLMAIPPQVQNSGESRPFFKKLAEIRDQIRNLKMENVSMESLSMGMSGDYEVAVEEGATHVRIGRALFGKRDA